MKKTVPVLLILIFPILLSMGMILVPTDSVDEETGCGSGDGSAVLATGNLPDQVGVWKGDQISNAAAIINAGRVVDGVDQRDQTIAVMTAMGESSLHNINYGDWETAGVVNPDGTPTSSVGLFQQQKWWGTLQERMDPSTSAILFYRVEVTISGRETMSEGQVAFDVQIGGSPAYYQQFWADAQQIVATLAGGSTTGRTNSSEWTAPLGAEWVLTDGFGWRIHPITGIDEFHSGIDMGAAQGTPVLAAGAGTVATVTDQGNSGYGRMIMITHSNGMTTVYGHLSQQLVTEGQSVYTGQQIGLVGSTGESTGPHLHFEIRVSGQPVDPIETMSGLGVNLDGTPGDFPVCQG